MRGIRLYILGLLQNRHESHVEALGSGGCGREGAAGVEFSETWRGLNFGFINGEEVSRSSLPGIWPTMPFAMLDHWSTWALVTPGLRRKRTGWKC